MVPLNSRTLSKLEQSAQIRGHFSLLVESVPYETNPVSAGTAPVDGVSVDTNCHMFCIVRRPHEGLPIPLQSVVSAICPIVSDNFQANALLLFDHVDRTSVVNPKSLQGPSAPSSLKWCLSALMAQLSAPRLAAPLTAPDVLLAGRLLSRLGGHHHDW